MFERINSYLNQFKIAAFSYFRHIMDIIPLCVRTKQKIKIILVQMSYPSSPFPGPNLPVGLGYIAEQLEIHKISYDISDLSLASQADLFLKISKSEPEFIGLSMMSLDVDQHYLLATRIKALFPNVKIVAGGAHISFVKAKALNECLAIDFGVVHEGEHTLVELLAGKELNNIQGLLYRDLSGSVVYTGDRCFVEDLDSLQFPKYSRFRLSRYGRQMSLASSRGCPFFCTFCGAFLSMGRMWRARNIPNIVAELEYWYDKGYTDFNFIDSNFFMSRERISGLCDSLENKHIKINLSSDGMRAKDADRNLLIKLKKFGLQRIAVGIESANNDILRSIKKGETVEDLEDCMKLLDELDIDVIAFFIIGLPGETARHVFNSFDFALKYHNIYRAYFFNPNPLPGTDLFDMAQQNDMIKATDAEIYANIGGMGNRILLETNELSINDRTILANLAKLVSRQVENNYAIKRERTYLDSNKYKDITIETKEFNNKYKQMRSTFKMY